MNLFQLLFGKKQTINQREAFLLDHLISAAGKLQLPLQESIKSIKSASCTPLTQNKEVIIRYRFRAETLPICSDLPNGVPFASIKTNFGWVSFVLMNQKITFIYYDFVEPENFLETCTVEEIIFYPDLFDTPVIEQHYSDLHELPDCWSFVKNLSIVQELPALKPEFLSLWKSFYRINPPEEYCEFLNVRSDLCTEFWRLGGLENLNQVCFPECNYLTFAEIMTPEMIENSTPPNYLAFRSGDQTGTIFCCNLETETNTPINTSLTAYLANLKS